MSKDIGATKVLTVRIPALLKDGLVKHELKTGIPKQRALCEMIQDFLIDQKILKINYSLDYAEIYPKTKMGRDEKNKIRHEMMKHCTMPTKEGMHRHHWSYREEHLNDIIYINSNRHMRLHGVLRLDFDAKIYRTIGGALLDTKAKHMKYLALCESRKKLVYRGDDWHKQTEKIKSMED